MLNIGDASVDPTKLYFKKHVAAIYGVDPRTVSKMIDRGDLPVVRIGDHEKILGQAVIDHVRAGAAR